MLRNMIIALAAGLSSCAPAPPSMRATDAIELLERYAAGGSGVDICTDEGRALLRGAVRSYGAEMQTAGVAWPTFPGADGGSLSAVDATVIMGVTSGFIEPSDLRGQARALAGRFTLANFPQIRDFRRAARVACAELSQLQQTASRYVIEADRLERVAARAERGRSERDSERVRRQSERLENTLAQMHALAERVEARVAESRRAG